MLLASVRLSASKCIWEALLRSSQDQTDPTCRCGRADGSGGAAQPPLQPGNAGQSPKQQPKPVHSCGQPYRPNILRYMKRMGFKELGTSPGSFAVPEGTPSSVKLARAIALAEDAQQRSWKPPGPAPKTDLVEQVSPLRPALCQLSAHSPSHPRGAAVVTAVAADVC